MNIIVSPTTSKHTITSTMDEKTEREFVEDEIPVLCVTADGLPRLYTAQQLEIALDGLNKDVHIDPEKRTILIGTEVDSIVDAKDLNNSVRIDEFFKRWTETQELYLIFNCYYNNEYTCSMRGRWIKDKWDWIKYENEIFVQVAKPMDGDT